MAVDLVLRLCQVPFEQGGLPGSDPGQPDFNPAHEHIAMEFFLAALIDVALGYHTTSAIKTFYNMPTNQQGQFDSLIAEITADDPATSAPPSNVLKMGRIHRVRSILVKWEGRNNINVPAYDTPDDIQTWLLAVSDGTFG